MEEKVACPGHEIVNFCGNALVARCPGALGNLLESNLIFFIFFVFSFFRFFVFFFGFLAALAASLCGKNGVIAGIRARKHACLGLAYRLFGPFGKGYQHWYR